MKIKTRWEIAERDAEDIVERLAPYCERIEIAGSLRRLKPEVGDIEIVAIPKPVTDLFGTFAPLTSDHALNRVDWEQYGKVLADGNKLKKIQLWEGMQLDMFIVTPPAQWGVQFLIRTGPAEYSHRFVKATWRHDAWTLGGKRRCYLARRNDSADAGRSRRIPRDRIAV